jgi:aminoglycoside phosphotransferase
VRETWVVSRQPDPALRTVLRRLGVSSVTLLGEGGEARVYAIDDERVLRVPRHHGSEEVKRRQELIDELTAHGATFAMPELLDLEEVDGQCFVIERRLPGRSLMDELTVAEGNRRVALIERHLEAAAAIGRLHVAPRDWYGEVIGLDTEPIRTGTWRQYLIARAARSLKQNPWGRRGIDPEELVAGLPDCAEPAFVDLDAFAGNMLTDGTAITAVIDIGAYGVVGDARLNPLVAAVHLASPEITPPTIRQDVDVAHAWLRAAGLADWFAPAQRWLAAFWCFATDDTVLQAWCRSVLLSHPT